jgi:hypothetical protein
VVMVPSNEDSAPPPLVGDRDVVMSMELEPSPAVGVASVEEVMDMEACRYMDFPGIGAINLDAPELLGNDRELLEAATERMFAEPTILETIASVVSALRQYESAGGSAPPSTPEVAEGRLRSPWPARSRMRLRPRHRRPERTRGRPCPSPREQSHPR